MTTQDNTIDGEEKSSFVFYHVNRLLIVALSTIALAFDDYQVSDIFYGISIVIWLWLPEIEVLERKITRNIIKQISIMLLSAFIVISCYIILLTLAQIINFLPYYETWFLIAVVVSGAIPLFYKTIVLLVINNPVKNIGKEFSKEALK